jgi:uridine phosphorylase
MKAPGESLLKPKALKGFSRRNAVYMPVDTPSRVIWKALKKRASRTKETPFGHVFLLNKMVVLYGCVGASLAAMGLEHLIATGTEKILILGFCGSLNPDLSCLDIVSVKKALSDEGTSGHYIKRKKIFHSSGSMRQEVEKGLAERNLPFFEGVTVSTDAPYRETRDWVLDKQNRGIDVVDMEASAVFALAEFYDIPAAALMVVSDDLTGKKWKNLFNYPKLNTRINQYFFPFL